MNIQKKYITKKIILLQFGTQLELASTFLRFQEHYESPEFKGKVFTLAEYQGWYEKQKGSFSYYTDWGGFNVPSYVFTSFLRGDFDPLSPEEKQVLALLDGNEEPFYVIGLFGEHGEKGMDGYLAHETAHGLFYTDAEYRAKVLEELGKHDLRELKEWLRAKAGYHEDVMDDECHAYCISGSSKMTFKVPPALHESLKRLFLHHRNLKST